MPLVPRQDAESLNECRNNHRIGSRRSAFRRTTAIAIAAAALALVAAWFARAPILEAAAKAWVVHDAINPADAIVGRLGDPALCGGGKNGFAAKMLVSDVKPSPAGKLGVVASHVDQNRAVLLKFGVSAEAITGFGAGVTNTCG
jgi:hypothetical protein